MCVALWATFKHWHTELGSSTGLQVFRAVRDEGERPLEALTMEIP
jgi:hypothetical protein